MPPGNTASTGTITLNDIAMEFKDTVSGTSASLGDFYRGGGNMPTVNSTVPASGAIALSNFYNIEKPSKNLSMRTASGTFTAPAGITKAYVIVVGGGGGGGNGQAPTSGTRDSTPTPQYSGGAGGYGGMAIGTVTLTPGTVYNITVGGGGNGSDSGNGGAGGSSSAFGLSATGGAGGVAATPAGTGAAGASGTGSGGNILNSNITNAGWNTYLTTTGWQETTATGPGQATERSSMSTLASQTATTNVNRVLTAVTWTTTGSVRPGTNGAGEVGGDYSQLINTGGRAGADTNANFPAPDASGGYSGSVIILY